MTRAHRITREIQALDRDLFCERDRKGAYHIMRRGYRHDSYEMADGSLIRFLVSHPHHIVSLTHNWSVGGSPVDWGLEPLMRKLREIDGWNEEAPVNQLEQQYERAKEEKARDFRNETEAFLKDFRSQFNKTFADVNTANMDKKLDKRRFKNGHL